MVPDPLAIFVSLALRAVGSWMRAVSLGAVTSWCQNCPAERQRSFPKTHAKPKVFIFLEFYTFPGLESETGFGGSRVCVVSLVCGGSHLRAFPRSSTAGGAKTTPEQVCVTLWHNTHPQVPGADFQGRAIGNPSRTLMVPWPAVARRGAKSFVKPTKSKGAEPYGSPFGNPLPLL